MNRIEWSRELKKGIRANDAAVIMGVNKFKNTVDLYTEKNENEKNIDVKKDALYFELKLEELVAKEFSLRTGKKIRKDLRSNWDKEYKFMISNIERKIIGENAILDCRVIYNSNKNYFDEELMDSILIASQHDMKVKEADVCYVAVLINNEEFIIKKINRDETLIVKIIEAEKDFWTNHIEKKINL